MPRVRQKKIIKDVGQCLISQDEYLAAAYNKENGVKAMQRLVPEEYKMRLGDTMMDMKEVDKNAHLHLDTVLLKEPGLYCFPLRCKRDEAQNSFGNSFATRGSKINLNHRRKRCSTCSKE